MPIEAQRRELAALRLQRRRRRIAAAAAAAAVVPAADQSALLACTQRSLCLCCRQPAVRRMLHSAAAATLQRCSRQRAAQRASPLLRTTRALCARARCAPRLLAVCCSLPRPNSTLADPMPQTRKSTRPGQEAAGNVRPWVGPLPGAGVFLPALAIEAAFFCPPLIVLPSLPGTHLRHGRRESRHEHVTHGLGDHIALRAGGRLAGRGRGNAAREAEGAHPDVIDVCKISDTIEELLER